MAGQKKRAFSNFVLDQYFSVLSTSVSDNNRYSLQAYSNRKGKKMQRGPTCCVNLLGERTWFNWKHLGRLGLNKGRCIVRIIVLSIICGFFLTMSMASAYGHGVLKGPTELRCWDKEKAYNGYTLFSAHGTTYPIDMEESVITMILAERSIEVTKYRYILSV